MPPKRTLAIVIILLVAVGTIAVISATGATLLPKQKGGDNKYNASYASSGAQGNNSGSGGSSLTIISISGGTLVGGSKYLITPNPFTGQGNYTIQDGGSDDRNTADGIVVINDLREGTYKVTQTEAPSGYERDRISKVVKINTTNGSSDTATFSDSPSGINNNYGGGIGGGSSISQLKSIVYTAKFECGTIFGNEGPLRPGHYDTDIGIFNKQEFPIKITWLATSNDGKSTNSILKTLAPQTSSNIVCQDLIRTFGNQSFIEGFVLIQVPLDPGILGTLSGSGTTVVGGRTSGDVNLLDVQVFYTANALDVLPHSVLVDKITFTILNDTSGKIPQSVMKKTLDISVPSNMSQISDPEKEVKQEVAKQYSLTGNEVAGLQLEIKSVGVGVGTMIDSHAISLSRLTPQTSS